MSAEVAYARIETPLGTILAVATREGLARLSVPSEDPDGILAQIAARVSPDLIESPRRLAPVRRELREYFAGTRQVFTLPLDLSTSRGFRRHVLEEMSALPYGEVVTYTELATRAGRPRAARAAGHACATNPLPIVVPCHRVIRRDGGLGGYTGGLHYKEYLLRLEGVF